MANNYYRRNLKNLCGRCYNPCTSLEHTLSCDACTKMFHYKCIKMTKEHLQHTRLNKNKYFCSRTCEMSIFPFTPIKDKEFIKINAVEIRNPCCKCGGECHKFDIIQCDQCLKWTHQVCTSLTREEFIRLGISSDQYLCSKKCEMKTLPYSNLTKTKFAETMGLNTLTRSDLKQTESSSLDVDPEPGENVVDEPSIICNYMEPCDVHKLGLEHGTKDLTIFHGNVESLQANLNRIEELFRYCQKLPDLIAITETKLRLNDLKEKNYQNIDLEGYKFEDCPTPTEKGGAGIYISNCIEYKIREDLCLNLDRCEDIWVEIQLGKSGNEINRKNINKLIVGVVYRHPGSQYKEFEARMCQNVSLINQNNSKVIILGDMNINLLKYNTVGCVSQYLNNLQGAGCLSYVNDKPTRFVKRGSRWEISCVDHIYSNLDHEKLETNVITSSISDHYSTFVKINQIKECTIPKTDIYTRKKTLTEAEETKLNSELQIAFENSNLTGVTNVDEKTKIIIDIYQNLIDKFFPIRKLSRKEKSFFCKPWITRGIRVSMDNRDRLQRKSIRLKTEEAITEYKKYKNCVTRLQKKAYNTFHSKKVTSNFHNKKKLWQSINEISNYKKRKSLDIKCLIKDKTEHRDPKSIANCLNNHFNSIGNEMAEKFRKQNTNSTSFSPIFPDPINSVYFGKTTVEEILKIIRKLNTNKAPGSDGISNYVIKKTQHTIVPILVNLFNECMENGIFPAPLKLARIVPIHKGGPMDNPTNYRPISLLPQFGKLFEKIIEIRLSKFLNKHNLITKEQYGFRKQYSTELAITDIQNALLKNLDENKLTCTVFLDLAKAFDSVNHEILLAKLERYGIRGTPLLLLKSYLSDRQHLTKYRDVESSKKIINIGVPQGSILGPLLFLLFINDLPKTTVFDVRLFADDTFLSLKGNDYKVLIKNANIELKKVSGWLSANRLTLNISKTKYMIIRRPRTKIDGNYSLRFNGKKLEKCTSYKYLGVHLDENLIWTQHIKYLCRKLSKFAKMFAKLRHCCNIDLLKVIYHALFHSHLQYCNVIWGNASERTLRPLAQLQDKIIKIMCFTPFGQNEIGHLYNELGLLNLEDIHKLAKAKFVFKLKNKKLPSNFDNFLVKNQQLQNYNLRNRGGNNFYKCVWGNTIYGSKMLQYDGAKIWNELPEYIQNLTKIKEFTRNYKSLLLSQYP